MAPYHPIAELNEYAFFFLDQEARYPQNQRESKDAEKYATDNTIKIDLKILNRYKT